jgi:hypothetical protein
LNKWPKLKDFPQFLVFFSGMGQEFDQKYFGEGPMGAWE